MTISFYGNKEFRQIILKRDKYTCRCCGMSNIRSLKFYGETLSIHHIDYNKKNCFPRNLITTCKICNAKANTNREYWKNFYSFVVAVA